MNTHCDKRPSSPRPSLILALGLLLALLLVTASTSWSRSWPRPEGPVADFAQVIAPEAQREIASLSGQLLQRAGVAVVVATLPSLEGGHLEETAVDLFRQWGIGKKDSNKGLLILVAVKEKRLRLEVGYGLEGVITDAQAGQIRDQVIIPRLREGNYGQGLLQGVAAVAQQVYGQAGISTGDLPAVQAAPAAPQSRRDRNSGHSIGLGIILFIAMLYLARRVMRSRGGGGGGGFWSGLFLGSILGGGRRHGGGDDSGSGGGFDGFGGGSSGGGGASGDFGDGGSDSGGGSDGD